jgi:F0F1-type ATP synthase epsilon subunit
MRLLVQLNSGELRFTGDGGQRKVVVAAGYASITPSSVTVLTPIVKYEAQ